MKTAKKQVWVQVSDQVVDQVLEQVEDQVSEQVRYQGGNHVRAQVWDYFKNYV